MFVTGALPVLTRLAESHAVVMFSFIKIVMTKTLRLLMEHCNPEELLTAL